jgi:hypothetical protein
MRYLVAGGLGLLNLAIGVGIGLAIGAGIVTVIDGPDTSPYTIEYVLIGCSIVFGLGVGAVLARYEWRHFKANFRPCPHCLSYVKSAATRCQHCQTEI